MSKGLEKTEALYRADFLKSTKIHFDTINVEGKPYIRLDKMTPTQMRTFLTLLHGFKQTTFFTVEATFTDSTTVSFNVDSGSLYTVKDAKKQIEQQEGTPSNQLKVLITRAYRYIPRNAELSALESVLSLHDENSGQSEHLDDDDDNKYLVIEASNNTVIQAGDELHLERLLVMDRTFAIDDDVAVLDIYNNKNGTLQAQWRKAKIIHIHDLLVTIHYCGWDQTHDFTLDLSIDNQKRRITHESTLNEEQQFLSRFTKMGLNDEIKMASKISAVESLLLFYEQLYNYV